MGYRDKPEASQTPRRWGIRLQFLEVGTTAAF